MSPFKNIPKGIQYDDSGERLWIRNMYSTGHIFGLFLVYGDKNYGTRQVYLCRKGEMTDYFDVFLRDSIYFFKL